MINSFHCTFATSGGNKAATQGNGELAAEVASSNGYTCRDCRMLSARTDALTAHSAVHGPTSRVYSRDRTLRPRKSASVVSKKVALAFSFLVNLTVAEGVAPGLVFASSVLHSQHRFRCLALFASQLNSVFSQSQIGPN